MMPYDADLQRVVAAWPKMTGPIKAAMLALVTSVTNVTPAKPGVGSNESEGFGNGAQGATP